MTDTDSAARTLERVFGHGFLQPHEEGALRALLAERDRLATTAQVYDAMRKGVQASAGLIGEALGRLAELVLAQGASAETWDYVAAQARDLRTLAGPQIPYRCGFDAHPAWLVDGRVPQACPWCALEQAAAAELTRMDEVMETEVAVHAARHEATAERDQARQIARKLRSYLGIWVDASLIVGLERDLAGYVGLDALPDWLTADAAPSHAPHSAAGEPEPTEAACAPGGERDDQ